MDSNSITELNTRAQAAHVEILHAGIRLTAPREGGQYVSVQPKHLHGVTRGRVTTFSQKSRRRLAEAFLTLRWERGLTWDVTFTLPGWKVCDRVAKAAWAAWSLQAAKDGWGAIWRMEQQQRGALHWHMVLGTPWTSETCTISRLKAEEERIRESWIGAEERAGVFRQPDAERAGGGARTAGAHDLGAHRYCQRIALEADQEQGRWMKYLAAHAMKDTHQVAHGRGRHWGIVGRKHWTVAAPLAAATLTAEEWAAIVTDWQVATREEREASYRRWRARQGDTLDAVTAYVDEQKLRALDQFGKTGTLRSFGRDLEPIIRRHAPHVFLNREG